MINSLKRLNSDQILWIAIILSVALHLILFMVISLQPNDKEQSSLGNGKIILLEHVADQPTKISEQLVDTQAASQKTDQNQNKGINGQQSEALENRIQQTVQVDSPHKENSKAQSTSNKGTLIDQSGTEQTPQERYRQLVTQHLLKRIKSSPTQGEATVHLNILKMGIATRVDVKLISGPISYQTWLNRQVLGANPLPAFPSDIKKASLKLAIKIAHQNEQ